MDSTLNLLDERSHLVAPVRVADSDKAAKELQIEHQRSLWAAADARLVATKLAAAKQHGLAVLRQLLTHSVDPEGKVAALENVAQAQLPPGDLAELKQRFSALFADTERLVTRIAEHQEGKEVQGQEYQELLRSMEQSMESMGSFIRRMEVAVGREGMPMTHDDFMRMMHGMDLEESKNTKSPVRHAPLQRLKEDEAAVVDALGRHAQQAEGYHAVRALGADVVQTAWRQEWEAQLAAQLPVDGSEMLAMLPKRW